MSGVDSSVLPGWLLCWNTHSLCGLGFRQVACAIGGVTRGAWVALRCIGDDAAAEQSLFTVSKRGRSKVMVKMTEMCWT